MLSTANNETFAKTSSYACMLVFKQKKMRIFLFKFVIAAHIEYIVYLLVKGDDILLARMCAGQTQGQIIGFWSRIDEVDNG